MDELALLERAKLRGQYRLECWRCLAPGEGINPNDVLAMVWSNRRQRYELRRRVWQEDIHNIVTNEGLDAILNIMLHGSTQITTWYCTLVESNTTPAAGMTYATPTYTESTAYDESTRPEYVEAAASSQSITNSANKAVFTINATKTMYGASLVGGGSAATTKGDTAGGGTLLCYAKFSASRSVVDDDVINLTYSVSAADDGV